MREDDEVGPTEGPGATVDHTATAGPSDAGASATEVGVGATVPAVSAARPRATPDGAYATLVTVDTTHYVLGDEISRGGMGRIRVARDRRLDRKVAIKEVVRASGELARRFEHEARITARLQHPSIVAVHEAGQWSTGTSFYAMPFIDGESLDAVVARARTLEERLALVPRVLAVADAMAYAHGHGIIHRDLKPKNVMVGRFGETIVIDWGLAKELGEAEVRLADGSGVARRGDETEHGTVLGTPAYMPPEQAEGAEVDARADAYALGAILYEVLAGRPPYRGTSSDDVLAQVRREPPPPLRALAPGVPADLAAIVAKAMARSPVDRYPSARELADDLRRFQTGLLVTARRHSAGERLLRWARRHRVILASAALAIAAIAAVTTVAFTRVVHERDQARAERNRAQAERGAAERLIDYVVVDLRAQLAGLGRLDALFGVGAEVDRYYGQVEPWRAERDPEATRRRAQALEVLGDVQDARGEHARAEAAYRRSLDLRQALLRDHPGERRAVVDVAHTHARIGQALADVRDADAQAALDEARRLLEPIAAGPLDVDTGTAIADALLASADLALKRDAIDRAQDELRQAIDALGRVQPADDRRLRLTLARAHERLGVALLDRGEHERALASFTTQLELDQQLADDEPSPARRASVEAAHAKVGRALEALGRMDEAQGHYATSMATARQLVAIDPSNTDWWHALASSASDYGTIRLQQQDLAGAQEAFTEAHAAIVRVAETAPDHQRWQRHVAVALSKLGQVKEGRRDLDGALADYQAAVAILARAVALDPDHAIARQQLAIGHSYVGDVQRARKDVEGALASYRAMIEAVRPAAGRADAQGVAFTKIQAVAHGMVAAVLATRDRAAAAAELTVAIGLLDGLRTGGRLDAEGDAYLARFTRQRTALAPPGK